MIRAGIRRAFHLALRRNRQWERDVDDEIALHLALRAEQLIANGVPREKAIEEAVRRFGKPDESRARLLEAARHREQRMHRAESFDNLRQDVSFALRSLRRQKGWTAVTITTIALGVGATTAVFSVVSSLLIHPLPYPNAGRIVFVHQQPSQGNNTGVNVRITPAAPAVLAWRKDAKHFESLEAYRTRPVSLRTGANPLPLNATAIEPTFPAFAGQLPLLGRMFTPGDVAASMPVVLLGEKSWRAQFAGDSSVVGRTIWLNDSASTIIGVLPTSLRTPELDDQASDVWMPLDLRDKSMGVSVIGRLRPGATMGDAAREMDSVFARTGGFGGAPFRTVLTTPAQSVRFHDSLIMLTGAVALVLLVAFANVGHLVIARSNSREREMAIRTALGAGRVRLFWQLLTESLALTLAGSISGVLVGWAALRIFVGLRPHSLSALAEVHLDGTTLAVALAVAVIGAVAFGIVGAAHSRRHSTSDALKSGTPDGSTTGARGRARAILVISEMALSTTLVVCATMVIRSVINLQQADLGFTPKNLYSVEITPPASQYATASARTEIMSRAMARLRHMPGVQSAAVTGNGPGRRTFLVGRLDVQGEPVTSTTSTAFIDKNDIESGYFRTMGIRLVAGSTFTDTSVGSSQVIVNDGFARRHWPGASALGHRLRVTLADSEPWLTVVGVAADAATTGAGAESSAPMLYVPSVLHDFSALMLRSSDVDPTAAIRAVVRSIDPRLTPQVRSIERQMAGSLAEPRFMMLLLSIFTVLALALSAIGLYGVMAFAVAQRTKEIGIRVALGASMGQIGRAVVVRGVGLAVAGAAVGVFVATWGTKLIEHELYGVARSDLSSFVVAVTVLLGAATVACIVPMRRAIGVDPIRAIRSE
jgi:putative ABC transport system permease protein